MITSLPLFQIETTLLIPHDFRLISLCNMVYELRLIGSKIICWVTTMKPSKLLFKVVELTGNIIIPQEIAYYFQAFSWKNEFALC